MITIYSKFWAHQDLVQALKEVWSKENDYIESIVYQLIVSSIDWLTNQSIDQLLNHSYSLAWSSLLCCVAAALPGSNERFSSMVSSSCAGSATGGWLVRL